MGLVVCNRKTKSKSTLTTSSKSSEGEMGGLSVSVKEPPPLSGPLLCDSLPDVNGDTSFIIFKQKLIKIAGTKTECVCV